MSRKSGSFLHPSRCLHTSRPSPMQVQRQPDKTWSRRTTTTPLRSRVEPREVVIQKPEVPVNHSKRNEVGVQLLSRKLHQQIFQNTSFPAPSDTYVRIARDHLKMHGLDPAQGSVLPEIDLTLPPLQGHNLDEHFNHIGAQTAQPWLSMANELSTSQLPPKPEQWHIQSGWTKYVRHPNGSSSCMPVDYPEHDGKPETKLVFDVETLPEYSPFAVMACAASKDAWYSWVSPWLLGESTDPQHLIPLGDPSVPRVVVGHNVSYDRGRISEEYSLQGTQTRFLDTMSLHVAVSGISSHQRPAWIKHRKNKQKKADELKEGTIGVVMELMREAELKQQQEKNVHKKEQLRRLRQEMEETLPEIQQHDFTEFEETGSTKSWEDITAANALADVARLHCGIQMSKDTRDDFMKLSPSAIRSNIQHYLTYCATDVHITHAVFAKTLPAFLSACPSPVSFAGILTMGSSFLTVNQEWEAYLENAERTYIELETKVKLRLHELAHEAKSMVENKKWKDDVWLSQLDWTPKVASKTRGVGLEVDESGTSASASPSAALQNHVPAWYKEFLQIGPLSSGVINRILPFLLKMTYDGHTLLYTSAERWHYVVDGEITRLPTAGKKKMLSILSSSHGIPGLSCGRLSSNANDLVQAICNGDKSLDTLNRVIALAEEAAMLEPRFAEQDPWLRQLDWTLKSTPMSDTKSVKPKSSVTNREAKVYWPKWYWDLTKPQKDAPPGSLDLTVRNRAAPLLLRLSWQGWPLFYSREYGWTFRVPASAKFKTRSLPLSFYDTADELLKQHIQDGFIFYKLPHKDGEKANVGSPLTKNFMKYAQEGVLTSPGDAANDALDMNAQCSYWISARDRILKQTVVWQNDKSSLGFGRSDDPAKKWGMILPQVITMGTVTRRAIERTWLTASNAKKNRVGSELKAMVRAPDGYAIVGADVDSEELWISSVMGDAQFGLHGATAIGWMTLEGTKAAGTDLHSKTANILGISRDQAKVFNYSRIYGAGMRHAILLLLQANAAMLPEDAQKLSESLYASTKGKNTHRSNYFGRKFWFGGTESFVFNKLEEIAMSDKPQTPALGCGVTYALSKEYLPAEVGCDYMPSRINWVVQSSGVDYLHLLIVSMEHLIKHYGIQARYLISIHDEVRYLVKEEDRYRAALALQIANLWTRSLFAYKLGMDDLPQGVAFFSAVDVDKVLRKEVDMPCVTPSQPVPIPPGESLDILNILAKTNGGSLWPGGAPMKEFSAIASPKAPKDYQPPNCLAHRAEDPAWLRAQTTAELGEIKLLARRSRSSTIGGSAEKALQSCRKSPSKRRKVGNGDGIDWSDEMFTSAEHRS